jgi:hypothetical protein
MRRPAFDVAVAIRRIVLEVRCGENVIVDLTGLTDQTNRARLRDEVRQAGLTDNVRWYE